MPARTISPSPEAASWPSGWPSFTPKDNDPDDSFQLKVKQTLATEYGKENLKKAWISTCNKLHSVTSRIAQQGSSAIPILTYEQATSNDENIKTQMKQAGCFVVRNSISTEESRSLFDELQRFIADNKATITGWPAKNPAVFHLYSSPVQLKLRTHPRQLELQRALNSLFTDQNASTVEEAAKQAEPILYPDGLRVRQPGQEFLGLGPHIDGGSLARWCDAPYSKTYERIFGGLPEQYDPYDLTHRRDANPAYFPGGAQCSVLRNFQGWTALTPCAPGEGGLMLVPEIQTVTAYMLLRPFFRAPTPGSDDDWLSPEHWVLDLDSAWFPGTYRWDSQLLSPDSHPHLRLEQTLVSIPRVEPGDTIWWHADMCHAVETTHNGESPASVVYIPAAPSTPRNVDYIRGHWKDLVEGNPPEDYRYLDGSGPELVLSKQNERKMIGALDLSTISNQGRRALGEGV